eukprot:1188193-Prorocentrum_minimum.AAC.3
MPHAHRVETTRPLLSSVEGWMNTEDPNPRLNWMQEAMNDLRVRTGVSTGFKRGTSTTQLLESIRPLSRHLIALGEPFHSPLVVDYHSR